MRATASGTHSSTMANTPASASATASSTISRAASSFLPCTRKPPSVLTDCGREAEVAHHRDLGVEDGVDRVEALAAALELHRGGAGAHEAGRVGDGVLAPEVVAHPRQVGDDQRARLRARDRAGVVRHVVDGDVQRVVVPEHDHRHRVADEDHVDAGGVDRARRRRVVRGDHHERRAGALARDDVGRAECALSSLRSRPSRCPPPSRAPTAPGGRTKPIAFTAPASRSLGCSARGRAPARPATR